jgi:hypothetical protein
MFGWTVGCADYLFFPELRRAPCDAAFKRKYFRSDLVIFLPIMLRKICSYETLFFLRFPRFLARQFNSLPLRLPCPLDQTPLGVENCGRMPHLDREVVEKC